VETIFLVDVKIKNCPSLEFFEDFDIRNIDWDIRNPSCTSLFVRKAAEFLLSTGPRAVITRISLSRIPDLWRY
jgi:hypothetical protein